MSKPSLTRFVSRENSIVREQLCFGTPVAQECHCFPEGVGVAYRFLPGQVFGVVRWERHTDGRQHWVLAVVQALRNPGDGFALTGIDPEVAVHAMIDQHTPAGQEGAVDEFLDLIDRIKRSGKDPAKISARYYRAASYRIMLGERPLALTAGDYAADGKTACES